MKRKLYFTVIGVALLALLWIAWPAKRSGGTGDDSKGATTSASRTHPQIGDATRERTARQRPEGEKPHREIGSLVKSLTDGDVIKLTPAQVGAYLAAHHRDADSLLAANLLGKDDTFLREALERFPDNTRVLLASIRQTKDLAGRLHSIEAFKRADPDNALGNCLAAKTLFELGKPEEAVAEMLLAKGKALNDSTLQSCQNTEEGYLSAGLSPLEAKVTSLYSASKPELIQIRGLAKELAKLRAASAAAGDSQRADALTDIQVELARNLDGGGTIIDQMVGMLVEKGAIKDNDSPESLARLEEIDRQREELTKGAYKISELMKNPDVQETDWLSYFDRSKLFGEAAANDWMLKKQAAP